MKQSLSIASRTLARGRSRAFVSRVAWLDLERLISTTFQDISTSSEETSELGNIYLTRNTDYPPFNKEHFSVVNITNQIQVHTGWRQLNLSRSTIENGEAQAELLAESGATLWYSQDATGSVMVFLAPYESKAMSINEENIILARYSCASNVSARDVQQHFAAYFRYCSVTSVHGNLGLSGYIFRLWLRYGDLRYASTMRASLFRYIERLIFVLAGIAGLYGGKQLFG